MGSTNGSDTTVEISQSKPTTLGALESFGFNKILKAESKKRNSRLKASPGDPNIFHATTPEETAKVYNKLLVTVGKWNADMYLKIKNRMDEAVRTENSPVCPDFLETIGSKKCIFVSGNKLLTSEQNTSQRKYNVCKPKKFTQSYPVEVPEIVIEPSYKNIFKNAKNNRKPHVEEQSFIWDSPDRSLNVLHHPDSQSGSASKETMAPEKPCELMPNLSNNYLLEVRERKNQAKKKHTQERSKAEDDLDTIAALFQDIPIKYVLHRNLEEQVQTMKAAIGERLVKVDPEDELKGFNYMQNAMLGAEQEIEEFQGRIHDERWRKKFDIDKIEHSDEADTIDFSEIDVSDSSSLCSGDSLNTSVDGKDRPAKPSRIPYMEEVHHKRDYLYDCIARKWEKVVKKNLIEPNLLLTPIFRGLYTDFKMRSSDRHYDKIVHLLNTKFEDLYYKTFVPYKQRLEDKIRKYASLEAKTTRIAYERRAHESAIRRKVEPSREIKVIDNTPTKYLKYNQKIRLKCIMKNVQKREETGMTDWKKKALVNEYVNLQPIISTKHATKVTSLKPKKLRSFPKKAQKNKPMVEFKQPLLADSSLYFDMQSVNPLRKGWI